MKYIRAACTLACMLILAWPNHPPKIFNKETIAQLRSHAYIYSYESAYTELTCGSPVAAAPGHEPGLLQQRDPAALRL